MEAVNIKGVLKVAIDAKTLCIPYIDVDKMEKKILDLNKRKSAAVLLVLRKELYLGAVCLREVCIRRNLCRRSHFSPL